MLRLYSDLEKESCVNQSQCGGTRQEPGRFYTRSSRDIDDASESSGSKPHGLQCVPLQP